MTSGFRLVGPPKKGESGNTLFKIAFSPDGTKLAVGYHDVTALELFDGQSLAPLPRPNLEGLRPRVGLTRSEWEGLSRAEREQRWENLTPPGGSVTPDCSGCRKSHGQQMAPSFLREAVILKEMMKKIALSL